MDDTRKTIHEAISDAISEADQGMVSGWVLIVETVKEEDIRDLELISSDATGDHSLPPWSGRGWLDHAQNDLEWDDLPIESEDE